MENLYEGLILTAEGMAATFVIAAIIICLSALVRLIAGGSAFRMSATQSAEAASGKYLEEEDSEKAAVIAAVTAVMDNTPFKIHAVKSTGGPKTSYGDGEGGEWERSVREEAARFQGGDP